MNYRSFAIPTLRKDSTVDERSQAQCGSHTLKRVLERAIPQTLQDVVLIYASGPETKNGGFRRELRQEDLSPMHQGSFGLPFKSPRRPASAVLGSGC